MKYEMLIRHLSPLDASNRVIKPEAITAARKAISLDIKRHGG